ncbi:MAG: M14 family metallocarboxypeptidase [Verrucomicrobiota bacterium]
MNRAHSGHDVDFLIGEWQRLCAKANWKRQLLVDVSGWPIEAIEIPGQGGGAGLPDYISSGVHGDECAPIWALLDWARDLADGQSTLDRPITVVPCLNPWGIANNSRGDESGIDLNRHFQDETHPVIGPWRRYLGGRDFGLALNLHEDFDGRGIYLYEIWRDQSIGEFLLNQCERIIAREPDGMVDGRPAEGGLLAADEAEIRDVVEEELEGGTPEAIYLFLEHAQRSLTFETPSEHDLEVRIAAHRRFINAALACGR